MQTTSGYYLIAQNAFSLLTSDPASEWTKLSEQTEKYFPTIRTFDRIKSARK